MGVIADLVSPYWKPGSMGRPVKVDRRRVVDAIFYVVATGCQWRALPESYPNWNTVHRYHLACPRRHLGTDRRAPGGGVRQKEGARGNPPPASSMPARPRRGHGSKETKGFDAGKKINGRKTFGIVDTLGLLMAVAVVAASTSDNAGGITVADRARNRSARFAQLWCDSGFKRTFIEHCRNHHVGVEVVNRIHPVVSRCSQNAGSSSAPGRGS